MEQLLKKIGSFTDIILYSSLLNLISLSYSFTKSISYLVNRFAVVIGLVVSRVITGGVDAVSVRICSSVRS